MPTAPRADLIARPFNASAMPRSVIVPRLNRPKKGSQLLRKRICAPHQRTAPNCAGIWQIGRISKAGPAARFAASAALVRSNISRRSFSASAAYGCSMKGSAFSAEFGNHKRHALG